MTDVAQRVRNIIATDLVLEPSAVADDKTLYDLGAESFEEVLTVMQHIERALGVTLTDEDIEFTTVGRLVDVVQHLHLALRP